MHPVAVAAFLHCENLRAEAFWRRIAARAQQLQAKG